MKKIFVLLLIALLLPAAAYAAEVTAVLPEFDVTLGGVKTENANRRFPLLVYKDITYLPMTYYDCRYLGLTTGWDSETGTFYVNKDNNITCAPRDYRWQWENPKANRASVCSFNIVVNGKTIENSKEEYPLLTFRDVVYFPLTWRFAAEEFGWEYTFDAKTGLSVNTGNYRTEILKLPNASGDAATDGRYYYYNGISEGKNVIYRAAASDTQSAEVIYELPETPLSRYATFTESEGEIYFKYFAGYSPVMSSAYSFKTEEDGSVTAGEPAYYSDGGHGYSELCVRENGIFVKCVNQYFDSGTRFTYEINGVVTEVPEPGGRVRVGRRRNGVNISGELHECVKIYGDKIYYIASDLDAGTDSALYCIDTASGKTQKLIDGVCGFHVYTGREESEAAESTMILYDSGGRLMRYTEINNTERVVYDAQNEGLMLKSAAGGYTLYTVMQSAGGDRTVVQAFDSYASGGGSLNGEVLLDTDHGVFSEVLSGKLCVYLNSEAPTEKRLLVLDGETRFYSSDPAADVFIYEDILLYRLSDNTIVKVNLQDKL